MDFIEVLKVIIIGIVEGVTEWLPISSTGHMLLLDEFLKMNVSDDFKQMFIVVIQLGAILAVVVLYWKKMFPFGFEQKGTGKKFVVKKDIITMWLKVLVACIPAAVMGFFFDDFLEAHLSTPFVISIALIFYGILFIVIERRNKTRIPKVNSLAEVTYKTALIIGLFQVLSMVPGTSRSGATIIGAIIIGTSRTVAAEFTFFLAVPTMLGASLLRLVKFGFFFTGSELATLILGMVVAFVVSILAIKFLMGYIKKHDFAAFGWYRIALGIAVLLYFGITALA
ncbi:MAG: undecaprenyl-diphosphate phosphatase [Oscillospiraceae bacterium]